MDRDSVTTFKPAKVTWISEGTAAKQTGASGEVREGGVYQGLIDVKEIKGSANLIFYPSYPTYQPGVTAHHHQQDKQGQRDKFW